MIATARSFTLEGISARPVRVEVDVHRGLPSFSVIGLPDMAVRELRERVRAAMTNSGFEFPLGRVVVNFAPARLRKSGPGLDLAVAVAVLVASGQLDLPQLPRLAIVGELTLSGSVRTVAGALPSAEAARAQDSEAVLVPAENGPEAALAEGIDVIGLEHLAQLREFATDEWKPPRPEPMSLTSSGRGPDPDMADLRGNDRLRYALELAAAGNHSLRIIGPPGSGKSLAASRIPSILPPLGREEALEVVRIASACGRLGGGVEGDQAARRPFRAPHHTISAAGLAGGGHPGEATLAHQGVLFLDDVCEFDPDALRPLPTALETGRVGLKGTGAMRWLPARFLLVAAANPCPCGRGDDDTDCSCPPWAVLRHTERLAGEMAERFDIRVSIRRPNAADIAGPPGESSAAVRERVILARERQVKRLGPGRCNAEMPALEVRDCGLEEDAASLLSSCHTGGCAGQRDEESALCLARTIADLAGAEAIELEQMALALTLR